MDTILEMRGITKTFPGVRALDDVNLAVRRGEIRALVGENGAGKSTLMKVLSGVYPHGSYDGEILFDGEPVKFGGITDSERRGIVIIHQELALVPQMSIAENIFLGNEVATRGVIDRNATNDRTAALLAKVGLRESPEAKVGDLGMGKQQLVEIAKALSKRVRLLILDEPTSSLNERESDALLALLDELRSQGITAILISHKLNEISKIADSITVLRDGATVAHHDAMVSEEQIVREMVGRSMENRYPDRAPKIGEVVMQVRDWTVADPLRPERHAVDHVSFDLRRGEVLGFAGLMGAGRTELAMSLFGQSFGRRLSGTASIDGRPAGLCDRGPQVAGPGAGRQRAPQHPAGEPAGDRAGRRHRPHARAPRGRGLPPPRQHQDPLDRGADREPVGRQPAEGRAVQVAVRRPRDPDPRRTHARHRRGREI